MNASELWTAWRSHEINFRKTRTDMENPTKSPPFRSYWEAWRDAFVDTFANMGLHGDADDAATICVDDHRSREQFADASPGLAGLADYRLAILSNADDRFLHGCIAYNGWAFDTVVSSEQTMAYKPDPRIFASFCEIAGVEPAHILYVGDSLYDDVHGAKLAGMQAVLIRREGEAPPTGIVHPSGQTPPPDEVVLLPPDFEVPSITELANMLKS
jgi:2-haloalkanoic acid dehalogenase type II